MKRFLRSRIKLEKFIKTVTIERNITITRHESNRYTKSEQGRTTSSMSQEILSGSQKIFGWIPALSKDGQIRRFGRKYSTLAIIEVSGLLNSNPIAIPNATLEKSLKKHAMCISRHSRLANPDTNSPRLPKQKRGSLAKRLALGQGNTAGGMSRHGLTFQESNEFNHDGCPAAIMGTYNHF